MHVSIRLLVTSRITLTSPSRHLSLPRRSHRRCFLIDAPCCTPRGRRGRGWGALVGMRAAPPETGHWSTPTGGHDRLGSLSDSCASFFSPGTGTGSRRSSTTAPTCVPFPDDRRCLQDAHLRRRCTRRLLACAPCRRRPPLAVSPRITWPSSQRGTSRTPSWRPSPRNPPRPTPTSTCSSSTTARCDRTAERAAAQGALVRRLPFNLGVGGRCEPASTSRGGAATTWPSRSTPTVSTIPAARAVVSGPRPGRCRRSAPASPPPTRRTEVRGPRRWAMVMFARVLTRLAHTPITDGNLRLPGCRPQGDRRSSPPTTPRSTSATPSSRSSSRCAPGAWSRRCRSRCGAGPPAPPAHRPARAAVYLFRAVVALALALVRRWPTQIAAAERRRGRRSATPSGGRDGQAQLLGMAMAVAILLTLFEMMRRHRLREKYALIWFVIAVCALVVAAGARPAELGYVGCLGLVLSRPIFCSCVACPLVLLLLSLQQKLRARGRLEERTPHRPTAGRSGPAAPRGSNGRPREADDRGA